MTKKRLAPFRLPIGEGRELRLLDRSGGERLFPVIEEVRGRVEEARDRVTRRVRER